MAKRNYFKRILAGTLAILTVAGYMPANVGDFLTGGMEIVANAETKVIANGVSYKSGDTIDFGEGAYIKSTWWGNVKQLSGEKNFYYLFYADADPHYYCVIEDFGDYNINSDGS
ncbi:MAG: hypothetical protein IJJ69_12780, partial [Oscillospiraceae bacterium]|nr:hypothetical protein [Oscillospiraceae bacterium]